jgi:predicted DNA-binding helix-hairpin-helix protein
MSEWIDGINDAVNSEATRDAALQKLAAFRSRHNFEPRLQEVETYLREEGRPCHELIRRADAFHDGTLRAKGIIAEILGSASDTDYELRKPEILKQLENLYGRVDAELTRVIDFLQVKQTRVVPWFGPREPIHAN